MVDMAAAEEEATEVAGDGVQRNDGEEVAGEEAGMEAAVIKEVVEVMVGITSMEEANMEILVEAMELTTMAQFMTKKCSQNKGLNKIPDRSSHLEQYLI